MTRISVGNGAERYDVVVGSNLDDEVLAAVDDGCRVAVVHAASMSARAERIAAALRTADHVVALIAVPDGEPAKQLDSAARVWDELAAQGISRTDAIVGVGGGATTDLAGFVAATWLRGVRVVMVPTTLLGMVDAAVGGKTAINTQAGKNLVGAVHPPAGVVCDLDALATLPRDEYVSGMAEVVKAGFIADPVILDLIEADPRAATTADGPHTRELVERAIEVKARVVTDDLHERGGREILNYGHTLGHAIEKVEDFHGRHGEAVSVGMVYAAALSRRVRGLGDDVAARHRSVLEELGLPTSYDGSAWPKLVDAMRVDKKVRSGRQRFVLLDTIAAPVVVDDVANEDMERAFAEVAR
jgi:3-dehydroquinate synthase